MTNTEQSECSTTSNSNEEDFNSGHCNNRVVTCMEI